MLCNNAVFSQNDLKEFIGSLRKNNEFYIVKKVFCEIRNFSQPKAFNMLRQSSTMGSLRS